MTGIADRELFACLFEDVTNIRFVLEPANTFRPNDIRRPVSGNKLIKKTQVEGITTIVDECTDTILLSFTFVMVVMMVVMAMMMFVFFIVIVVIIIIFFMMSFYLMNPCSRRCHIIKVEHFCVENSVKVYITVVGLDNLSLRLKCLDDLTNQSQLISRHIRGFIQQNDITEFDLLDNQVFDVLFINPISHQTISATKLISHTHCVDNGDDAVDHRHAIVHIFQSHGRH